jgi:hypothetical protein
MSSHPAMGAGAARTLAGIACSNFDQETFVEKKEVGILKCRAYHEAGHAVMAAHIGVEIDEITVVRRVCMCQADEPTIQLDDVDLSPSGRLGIERASLVALAGPEAEAMHCFRTVWHPCSWSDGETPAYLARAVCGSEQLSKDWLSSVRTRAQEVLRAHERALNEIALALMTRKTLTGEEVMNCVFPFVEVIVKIN